MVIGNLVNGVQLDEEGFVYFATRHARRLGDKLFLEGKSGRFGTEKKGTLSLWVYGKGQPKELRVVSKRAPIPMDEIPKRPLELGDHDAWIDGVEWLYAGASPIVAGGCICPQSRFHVDWFKPAFKGLPGPAAAPKNFFAGFALFLLTGTGKRSILLRMNEGSIDPDRPGGKIVPATGFETSRIESRFPAIHLECIHRR